MNIRVFDWYTFSLGPILWKSTLKTNEDVLWYFSIGENRTEYVEMNHCHTHATRHGGFPFPADRFIFNYLHQMLPGLPFFHKVPVTKLIHIIIERGFNEGEMFLTFECHSLLLPAVWWLLRDKATPLQQTLTAIMRMVLKKYNNGRYRQLHITVI